MTESSLRKVLLTDHPWPDVDIERELCTSAGIELIDAPPNASAAELAALSVDVEGILTCWANVTKDVIEASPGLRVITRLGVGLDNIDVAWALQKNIVISRIPDYCIDEVSDHAVAFILGWARGIVPLNQALRDGTHTEQPQRLRRVRSLTVGIWGSGNNGRRTAEKLAGLGCHILLDDRHPEQSSPFEVVPAYELLERSDVVSLHLPLTDSTRGIVSRDAIARMRDDALLVNTARGGLIDETALLDALIDGTLGGAALDVLATEFDASSPLVGRDDVVITPHVAFSSDESIEELRRRATEDVIAVLEGREPTHRVIVAP